MTSAREALQAAAKKRILLTDGGWGTQIQLKKLTEACYAGNLGLSHDQKGNNDILALTRPDVVTAIGESYLAAGSDIVSTNTFSANRISQADYGAEALAADINIESARLGRATAEKYEALDGRQRRGLFTAAPVGVGQVQQRLLRQHRACGQAFHALQALDGAFPAAGLQVVLGLFIQSLRRSVRRFVLGRCAAPGQQGQRRESRHQRSAPPTRNGHRQMVRSGPEARDYRERPL